jgi:hypothetical protein
MLGLSFGNLKRFHQQPRDTFIKIDGKEMNLPIDVMIFSGETDTTLSQLMAEHIGPDTKVHIDPKLKS